MLALGVEFRIEACLKNGPGVPERPSLNGVPGKGPEKVKEACVILTTLPSECRSGYKSVGPSIID